MIYEGYQGYFDYLGHSSVNTLYGRTRTNTSAKRNENIPSIMQNI